MASMPPQPNAAAGGKKDDKRLSVERIYQKKTQLEHILLRPDSYIGSAQPVTEQTWVFDSEENKMINREITFVPGLYKIFDEILVNAADNKQRDKNMDTIKIDIKPEQNEIKVYNNGEGIPCVQHAVEKMYVPTMIFGHLLTSSNFNDEQEKVTGGRNGFGAKLCNVFSTKFTVETCNKKKEFKQHWSNNMSKASEAKIKDSDKADYTQITFYPDLAKFHMETLDADTVALLSRRAYDIAASTRGVKVFLNGKRIPVKNFKDYVDLFIKGQEDDQGNQIKCVHEVCNDRWEVAIAPSIDKGFQQMSFVNSIATTKGGRHTDHVADLVVKTLIDSIKKKNKTGVNLKPFQIKSHMQLFVNCLIVNPTFDSQTKDMMTLQVKAWKGEAKHVKATLSEKFSQNLHKSGIVENILAWSRFKADQQKDKKQSGRKTNKLKGIPKLEDANDAGTKGAMDCTLILTEGDSAKTLAVSGLSVVGRDRYGVYPLRGKLLNVREASPKQVMDNKEITEMVKILGLQYKKKYSSIEDMKTLRYGKLMIMTDQDQDGSHIKGLIINFVHHNWPGLLKLPFLEEFITPIVKVSKGSETRPFYSLPEFNEWKDATANWNTYKIKYYKGLGTSTSKEAKEYFTDMKRHRILFNHESDMDDHAINMAFSKKAIEQRKEWLGNWMEEGKRRKELGLPEVYLYEKNTKAVTYVDFVNKELVLFSNLDNERSIPCIVDGFKPGQRKVVFSCIKKGIEKKEMKVAQLAGSVGELSAYHHGEASLMGTIINLAQNYVGSNNINLLEPIGQFGTRLAGGKDHASARYIFTKLSPLTKLIFNDNDLPLLKHLTDDNQKVEPEWYIPIIPMVLVNGAEGIGTGWSTRIHNYDPREIVRNLRLMIDGEEPREMKPWFKGFTGSIDYLDATRYVVNGEIATISDVMVEITELPIRTWTQHYKETVMEPYLNGSEKVPAQISDYREYHTDKTVKFQVQMSAEKLRAEELGKGLHQFFKLQTTISTGSMVLFDAQGCLRRYESVMEVLHDFFELRMTFYRLRKEYLEGMLEAEALKLSNQARFIMEKCDGSLVVENKKKKLMVEELKHKKFDPDPVRKWKAIQDAKKKDSATSDVEDSESESEDSPASEGAHADYDYLLGMKMWNLTAEEKAKLLKKKDDKHQELRVLTATSKEDMWRSDLDEFVKKLDEVEAKELEDDTKSKKLGPAGDRKKMVKKAKAVYNPTPQGIRIAPKISEDLRIKAAKATEAKERKKNKGPKEEKTVKAEKDEFDDMLDTDEHNKSLTERLGLSGGEKKKPLAGVGGGGGGGGRKGGKKKNPWDSSPDASDSDAASGDGDGGDSPIVERKERGGVRRAAAAATKYADDDSGSSDGGGDVEMFETEDAAGMKPEAASNGNGAVNGRSKSPRSFAVSDSGSDFEASGSGARSYSTNAGGADDSKNADDLFNSLVSNGKSSSPSGASAAPAKPNTKNKYDSDSDDDDSIVYSSPDGSSRRSTPPPKKAAPPAKKAAPPAKKPAAAKPKADPKKTSGATSSSQPSMKAFLESKKAAAAARKNEASSDDGDDFRIDEDDEDDKPPAKKKAKHFDNSDDDDSDNEMLVKKPKKKATKKLGAIEDGDAAPLAKKAPAARKAPAAKKPAAAAKKSPAAKKKTRGADDSDFADGDSDGDFGAIRDFAPARDRPGRQKAQVNCNLADDDSDEDFY